MPSKTSPGCRPVTVTLEITVPGAVSSTRRSSFALVSTNSGVACATPLAQAATRAAARTRRAMAGRMGFSLVDLHRRGAQRGFFGRERLHAEFVIHAGRR